MIRYKAVYGCGTALSACLLLWLGVFYLIGTLSNILFFYLGIGLLAVFTVCLCGAVMAANPPGKQLRVVRVRDWHRDDDTSLPNGHAEILRKETPTD